MKHELHIVEEFQSSPWGQICVREALYVAREMMKKKKFVYLFKKVRSFGSEEEGSVFREGWAITDQRPGYYHSIGSLNSAHEVGYKMTTLYSKKGERKVPIDLETNYWSIWHKFNLMFGDAGLMHNAGRVTVKDKDLMGKLIAQWEDILTNADGRPMVSVLAEYTKDDIDRLTAMTEREIEYEVRTIDYMIAGDCSKNFDTENLPILAKGMDGIVNAARIRLGMRRDFWLRWNKVRGDILELAKEYSVTTDKWVSEEE